MRSTICGVLLLAFGGPAFAADEIKLPVVPGAADLDKNPGPVVYLNANEQGRVLLSSADDPKVRDTLDNAEQVRIYLNRLAKEQTALNLDAKPATLVLRAHTDCPFEKVYAITKAARMAGHTQSHWRVDRGAGKGEGQLPVPLRADDKADVKFVARVTATEKGQIEKLTLKGSDLPKDGLDLKADVAAFEKKLKELVAANKGKKIHLTIEIADKLLHAHVVELIDASVKAEIKDVSPVPIDPKKR